MPHSKPDPALAAAGRTLREERGITREALASQASSMCASEPTVMRIVGALGLSISRLAAAIEAAEGAPARAR